MFVSHSREARECRRQAEKCADIARIQSDPERRQEYLLEMQRRWLSLAQSYEFSERLEFPSRSKQGTKRGVR
jgi:hypothetical protein